MVTAGRKALKFSHPLNNIKFLDITESKVHDNRSFKYRKVTREGVEVYSDSMSYSSNFEVLIEQLRLELVKGDTIFTHNPWGEYGHAEHVQVFRAITSLIEELNLNVFVNGYVGDKTFEFMSNHYSLFSSESFIAHSNNELGQEIKQIYIFNNCWTWSNDYQWPPTEIFYRLLRTPEKSFYNQSNSSYPPLNVLKGKFTDSYLIIQFKRFIPNKVKLKLKKLLIIMRIRKDEHE